MPAPARATSFLSEVGEAGMKPGIVRGMRLGAMSGTTAMFGNGAEGVPKAGSAG